MEKTKNYTILILVYTLARMSQLYGSKSMRKEFIVISLKVGQQKRLESKKVAYESHHNTARVKHVNMRVIGVREVLLLHGFSYRNQYGLFNTTH